MPGAVMFAAYPTQSATTNSRACRLIRLVLSQLATRGLSGATGSDILLGSSSCQADFRCGRLGMVTRSLVYREPPIAQAGSQRSEAADNERMGPATLNNARATVPGAPP